MASRISETAVSSARTSARERLIVALDVSSARQARELVTSLGDIPGFYKVGLQLFTAEGPEFVRELAGAGHKVFLDLKLHDIPNTVARAVTSACGLGTSMLTVHAGGGAAMLKAAVEAAGDRLTLLAVTVLTSMNDDELTQVGVTGRVLDQVLRLGDLAQSAGCKGVVASARESSQLRQRLGEGFAIVNPGVRPPGTEQNDQRRVATPAEAIRAGASHLVVGRPITQAADPAKAAREIVAQIAQAASDFVTP
ncbi:MAG TPA: orotidine-5'-phosphate decarboxylase [Candidatus Angelobacter sp.]